MDGVAANSTNFAGVEQLNEGIARGRQQAGTAQQATSGNQAAQAQQTEQPVAVEQAGQDNDGPRFSPGDNRGQLLDIEV